MWFIQPSIAYSHLAASNEQGYALGAQYALYWFAIQAFKEQGIRWIDLGAAAGLANTADDGLSQFKRGWTSTVKTKYFCGRINDPHSYSQLVLDNPYFPPYRHEELI